MKILYVTTISSTMVFFTEHIRMLQNEGYTVELACNLTEPLPNKIVELDCQTHHIPFSRSPVKKTNFMAYKEIRDLIKCSDYDIVHTHTPVASAITRLVCRKERKKRLKVIYTAHGFHFYKGAPIKNWLIYFPIEWFCSFFTDVIITINSEDNVFAKNYLHSKRVEYVRGMGIEWIKFYEANVDKIKKRRDLGVPDECFLLLSVGELNKNKNHRIIIDAISKIKSDNIYYIIAGRGSYKEYLEKTIEQLGLCGRVLLLGYRKDVDVLYKTADAFCFPSRREGLGLAAIEAMASGLPIITSNIHGINDYSINGVTGYKCRSDDSREFAVAITKLSSESKLRGKMGKFNSEVAKKYDVSQTISSMYTIYGIKSKD